MIVITGADGFIGSNLVAHLNESFPLTKFLLVTSLKSDDKWKNLRSKKYYDILDRNAFIEQVRSNSLPYSIDTIVHLGASSSTTEIDCQYLLSNNYRYTRDLAQYSFDKNIRYIFASSAATYGNGELGFSDSDKITPLLKPTNPYGFSKWMIDQWLVTENLVDKCAGLRFFNVYGPNEYHKGGQSSPVPVFYKQLLDQGQIRLFKSERGDYNDGEQSRDFVSVYDCCKVITWLINNKDKNGIFNVGTGVAATWNSVAKAVFKAASKIHYNSNLPKELKIDYISMPDKLKHHYQYFTQADLNKLRLAGYSESFMSLDDGVDDYLRNYLSCNSYR